MICFISLSLDRVQLAWAKGDTLSYCTSSGHVLNKGGLGSVNELKRLIYGNGLSKIGVEK
jgi:hypothetical protein